MRKGFLLGGVLCALLLTTALAQATITVTLENPAAGPVSGFAIVSGWAFATVDGSTVAVTVKARIDGVTGNEIPCCGPRADVQAAFEGAPLNTSFAGQILYSNLAAGPHTIGIEVTSPGSDPIYIDRSVVVVKPGGVGFVTDMDVSGATAATDANGILVDGAVISPGGVTDDLDLDYQTSSQSFAIRGPAPTNAKLFVATLNGEQEAGAQEVHAGVDTPASGTATFTLNADNTLDYEVTVVGIPGTLVAVGGGPTSAAHIHGAPAGTNGGILIFLEPLDSLPTGPPFVWSGTTAVLDQTTIDALLAGGLYVNVHTVENMGGEVRGQIVASAQNCQDPSRTVFAGVGRGGTPGPGPGAGGSPATDGCRQFTDEASCEMAWQLNPFDISAQCLWFANFSACGACGGVLEGNGTCVNTCR